MNRAEAAQSQSSLWQRSTWYAALSLTERAASLSPASREASAAPRSERAARRLQAWKKQKPFDQEALFAQRLAQDSLSEDDLALLLSEPVSAVQERYLRNSPPPTWLTTLREAFENPETAVDIETLLSEEIAQKPLLLFLRPLLPLIGYYIDQLRAGIQELNEHYETLPFDPQQIVGAIFRNLPTQLLLQVSQTFVLEMHVAGLQQSLHGETPQERFTDFVSQLSQTEKILALLEEYPVLARQLVLTTENWAAYGLEFLTHLCADWQTIRAALAPEHDPGLLTEIKGGAGDPHRKGRSVLSLKWDSGFQLLYKPKALAVDVHFQELLAWLNAQGAQPPFRTVKIIDRGSYGWSEFVHAESCSSPEQVERFYERQGSYLALLYALNATDFHVENVIAAGEDPILVDLEALFHPYIASPDAVRLALASIDQSVLRVGLLPLRIWENEETIGVDLSGLGGEAGQMSPRPVPRWEDSGTDQMRLVRQRIELPTNQNRPTLNGSDVDVLDYSEQIVRGFKRMYRFLQERRDALLTTVLPRFAHDEIRLLLRPSRRYARLLRESYHPDVLRDALERERLFDHLWRETEIWPHLRKVIPAEKRDLFRGDLPLFTTHPDSCTLFTSDGEPLEAYCDESGLTQVRRRIQQLDEQDLARQVWIIEAALATLLIGPEQLSGKTFEIRPAQAPVSRERLLDSARAIGERLDQLALRNDYGAGWLGVSVVNEQAWSLLPAGSDLYSGTSGIALFLAYLGALTGEERYTSLAKLALAELRSQIEQQKENLQATNIGAFDGLGAAIYLLQHLSVLWNAPNLLQEAEALVELLPALIEKDESFDIIVGSAGCILNLLNLHEIHPAARTLAIARQCGDHLLAGAQVMQEGKAWTTIKHEQPLAGFAHGAAGIALSLLKLAAVSGDERYRQAAQEALAYERSLFLPEKGNWADLRSFSLLLAKAAGKNQKPYSRPGSEVGMVAWCHGAAGIGLSRLHMLTYLDDQAIREEIEAALATTIAHGFSDNHSLCHGALGNLETLLTAARTLDTPYYREQLERLTAMVVESSADGGWVTGVPRGVETPGLMTGLAGIGYELLRLAEPDKVPSVLVLAPPRRKASFLSIPQGQENPRAEV